MRPLTLLQAALTHDCGAKFRVAFEDVERPYTCPGCGVTESMGPDTMRGLMADFGRAMLEVHREHTAAGGEVNLRLDCHTGTFSHGEAEHG